MIKKILKGFSAGFLIGIAGAMFILAKAKNYNFLPSLVFPVGLYLICVFGLDLYTGKIGFGLDKEKALIITDYIIMLISNAAGAMLFGVIFNFIFGKDATAIAVVRSVAAAKFGELSFGFIISILIKSVLCGFFVYIAVYLFGRAEGAAGKVLAVWIPIAAFVFLGLEHSIANMFYFAAGAADALNGIVLILIAVIGNSVGAIALDSAIRFMSAPDKK